VNSGGQATEGRKRTVSDCVHASVKDVEPAGGDASADRAWMQIQCHEIGVVNDAVLLDCQLRDPQVDRTLKTFRTHSVLNVVVIVHRASLRGRV
jgi:hypothetical protein